MGPYVDLYGNSMGYRTNKYETGVSGKGVYPNNDDGTVHVASMIQTNPNQASFYFGMFKCSFQTNSWYIFGSV